MEDREGTLYKVLYDFNGSDSSELTCQENDIVVSLKTTDESMKNDWVLCMMQNNTDLKGHVPKSYLEEIPPAQAAEYLQDLPGSPAEPLPEPSVESLSPRPSVSGAPQGPSSVLSAAISQQSTPPSLNTSGFRTKFAGTALSTGMRRSGSSRLRDGPGRLSTRTVTGESFNEMFARHEHYFKTVMKQREETFKKLELNMSSAAKEIQQCQEKSAKLTQRIVDLDRLIEEERKRWKDRLDAEKKTLLMKSYSAAPSPQFTS
eukprot:gnl/Trimastix_PCT/2186.p1 GENE.gnl/Trimastix_PCT/2186~~gnl/Trimastix_PCT/2186.p1  ORF type:complete len:271 (+),score=58.07 gnl/Trimastix_PCT/2186:35-814(+)